MRSHHRVAVALSIPAFAAALALPSWTSAKSGASGSNARIINGTEVDAAGFAARWSFVVGLIDRSAKNQYDGQFCVGSLIDDQHVLTAAHCVVRPLDDIALPHRKAPSSIGIATGSQTLNDRSMTGLQNVSEIYVHPFYNAATSKYDVAVLRLAVPIAGAPTIPLLTGEQSGALGLRGAQVEGAGIAGWGDTDPVAAGGCCFPDILREATVPVRTDAVCSENAAKVRTSYDGDAQICAGTLQSPGELGKDTCQGDSGGPLTLNVDGVPHLAGVTSFGVGCAQRSFGVYARITGASSWVTSIPGSTTGDVRPPVAGGSDLRAPTRVKGVAVGYDKVKLTWAPPADGPAPASYVVWVRVGTPKEAVDLRLKATKGLTAIVPVPGVRTKATKYVFLIRALDAGSIEGTNGRGLAAPKVDPVKPTKVSSLSATRTGTTKIVAKWGKSVDKMTGVKGYEIAAKLGGKWVLVGDEPTRKHALGFTGAKSKTAYRVRAYDGAGNYSAWVTKTI